MAHPLVDQLRFARAEWLRGLRGVRDDDALRRIEPMNTIGWIVGHLGEGGSLPALDLLHDREQQLVP